MNQLESWVRLNLIMIKNKAVFFDRDGVLNKERKDYVKSISELKIFPYIGNAIKKLQSSGFLTIVITNQSAINRGLTSTENINAIHLTIQDFLKDFETKISHFYFCPHKPDENCSCRKPKSDLFFQAAKEFDISLKTSWMIGNNDSDIIAGNNAGCTSIKINSKSEFLDSINLILKSS